MSRREAAGNDRGQTVLDYAIGIGIFFVAVTFVVGTIPGMFTPFVGAGDTQVADRVASSLATGTLGSPDKPYVLDKNCTAGFFDQMNDNGTASTECRFDTNATDLGAVFALDSTQGINVQIENTTGVPATLDGTTLEAGRDPPPSTTVTSARRTVGIDDTTYWLVVQAW